MFYSNMYKPRSEISFVFSNEKFSKNRFKEIIFAIYVPNVYITIFFEFFLTFNNIFSI